MPTKGINPKVNAIYVNYRKARRLIESVESLRSRNHKLKIVITIVDNSCCEKERAILEDFVKNNNDVKCQYNLDNVGYTVAVNQAVANCDASSDILLVSPDVIQNEDSIVDNLFDLMRSNASVGLISPVQHNDDGSAVEVARHFPSILEQISRRLNRRRTIHVVVTENSDKELILTDWLQSSFVLIRRSVWLDAGGLNEKYFLFMADVELSLKASALGYHSAIAPRLHGLKADGIRASATGFLGVFTSEVLRIHIKDSLKFYRLNGWRRIKSKPSLKSE